jgi:hypothetical protein
VGHIYNVLIILAITLLMAVTTTVLAYVVDLLPQIVIDDNVALIASNDTSTSGSEAAQDN